MDPSNDPITQDTTQPEETPAAAPAPSPQLHGVLAEVETFWSNVFANVSPQVETSIHNFLAGETEALRARLAAIFQKEL
jgi:hypothetical protein